MQEAQDAAQGAADAAQQAATDGASRLDEAQAVLNRVVNGDFNQKTWIDLWTLVGWPIVQAIVLIILALFLSRWAKRLTTSALRRAHVEETLARFFGNAAKWILLVLAALVILSTFGVDTTAFAAVLAAVGFAIGMALSGTLANFASGIMLLVFRPFKVGDVVNAAGVLGKVDEIGMFTTTFDTFDKRRIIVPNGKIYGDTIENVTFHPVRRVEVVVGTEYAADVDQTRSVLERVVTSVEGGEKDPEPQVFLAELGDSAVTWKLRVWAQGDVYWDVFQRVTRDAKKALDEAGIGIPFPQSHLHLPDGVEVTVRNT
ncbi:MAG: mechanosensitive ion channel [Phycisphaerales bacterium]